MQNFLSAFVQDKFFRRLNSTLTIQIRSSIETVERI